jgi:soluble lytic murein transglycosylase
MTSCLPKIALGAGIIALVVTACTGGHPVPNAVARAEPALCEGRPLPMPLVAARPPLHMDAGGCVISGAKDVSQPTRRIPVLVGASFRDAIESLNEQSHIFPTPESRYRALRSMGWVAFRSGQYASARGVFQYLHDESPYSSYAPGAIYWAARSAEMLGMGETYLAELKTLVERFPVDYYSVQASRRLSDSAQVAEVKTADLNQGKLPHTLILARALVDVGDFKATRRLLQRTLTTQKESLGPEALLGFETLARRVESSYFERRFRWERNKRFPNISHESIRALGYSFPWTYVQIIARAARMTHVDSSLVIALARQESAFNPTAISHAGAMGLMQVMPQTANEVLGFSPDSVESAQLDILNPKLNAEVGAVYLSRMLRRHGGQVEYALASYNAGPAAVARWKNRFGDIPVDVFVEEIPYAETRDYVQRVLAWQQKYGFLDAARREISTLTKIQAPAATTPDRPISG